MKKYFSAGALASFWLIGVPTHSSPQDTQVAGFSPSMDCCLCTLHYDGKHFTWSCPCDNEMGGEGCNIDKSGCTNVGTCP